MQSFCAEWLALADAKLREFVSGPDTVPMSALAFSVDHTFQQLLVSLGRVSRRILGMVVLMVLTWRKNKIKDASLTGQRGAVLTVEDRVLLGAEFLCCTTLVSILSFVNKESLDDPEWCQEVEQTCFQNVVPSRGNNEEIRLNYALALGCLAPFRLPSITARFKQAVQQFQQKPDARNQLIIEPMLEAMSHLKLDISNQVNYTGVMQLLTVFVDLLLQSKGKHEDIRPLLVQTMVALLKPLLKYSQALPSGVDYSKWFQFVNATYAALYSKLVEPKNPRESRTPNYPLLVTLLCLQVCVCCPFLCSGSNQPGTRALPVHVLGPGGPHHGRQDHQEGQEDGPAPQLLVPAGGGAHAGAAFYHAGLGQEGAASRSGGACVCWGLLFTHHCSQTPTLFLDMVTARLFEIRDSKLGALPHESVDWMVAILTAMAKRSPHLTLRELNKLLVASGPGYLQKKIVGVRSLRKIGETSLDLLEHWPSVGEVMSEASVCACFLRAHSEPPEQVLAAVHNELGVALLATGKVAPADGDPMVALLCELIATCYYVTPDKIGLPKLFAMLATYLVHVCAPVRAVSAAPPPLCAAVRARWNDSGL